MRSTLRNKVVSSFADLGVDKFITDGFTFIFNCIKFLVTEGKCEIGATRAEPYFQAASDLELTRTKEP